MDRVSVLQLLLTLAICTSPCYGGIVRNERNVEQAPTLPSDETTTSRAVEANGDDGPLNLADVMNVEQELVYVYRCTGPYADTTDTECNNSGNPLVCFYVQNLARFKSCAKVCNGAQLYTMEETQCKLYSECVEFLHNYCKPELKEPTTSTTTTPTTTSTTTTRTTTTRTTTTSTTTTPTTTHATTTPTTPTTASVVPVPDVDKERKEDEQVKARSDPIDKYDEIVPDVLEEREKGKGSEMDGGELARTVVVPVSCVVVVVIAIVVAVIKLCPRPVQRQRNSGGSRSPSDVEDATEMDELTPRQLSASDPIVNRYLPVTTRAEQPTAEIGLLQEVPIRPIPSTDTNDEGPGRQLPPVVVKKPRRNSS